MMKEYEAKVAADKAEQERIEKEKEREKRKITMVDGKPRYLQGTAAQKNRNDET